MSKLIETWKDPYDVLDLERHVDPRGQLFEILRFKDQNVPGEGQLYTFSIEPGQRRGDHYHEHKREWFTCVYGKATILLNAPDGKRALIELDSEKPKIVYSAPKTVHTLMNNEKSPAVIVSYGSTQHDHENPDTIRKIAT